MTKMLRSSRKRLALAGLSLCLGLIVGCGDSDDPPGSPTTGIGGGDAYVLIQELDTGGGGGVLDEKIVFTSRVTYGIARTSKEGAGANLVAQDMTITFQFSSGGSLQLQVVNYKERAERGVPINNIQIFNPALDPLFTDAGETSVVRVTYFETQDDSIRQTPFNAPVSPASADASATVEDVTIDGLFGSFDAIVTDTETPRQLRIASVDASGAAGLFFAAPDDDPDQAFQPVAILQTTVTGNGPCDVDLDGSMSVDPNGLITSWGVDADGDFNLDDPPGWLPFNDGDPANPAPIQVTVPSGTLIRVFVQDEEGRTAISSNVLIQCP